MSRDILVLFRGPLPERAALAHAVRQLNFPLSIVKFSGTLAQQAGNLPVRLRGADTRVVFDVFDGRDIVVEAAGRHISDIDPAFDRVAGFGWDGDEHDMLCGVCGAAALAGLVNGVVLDQSGAPPRRPDEAVAEARRLLASVKPPDNRFGTGPADVRRYLRSLLKQRSDLVLIGRNLLIRPVRHLVRGAVLTPTGEKHRLSLWRHLDALYVPSSCRLAGYGKDVPRISHDVWQPHFAPLLMDVLAEEIFAELGAIISLMDFAPWLLPDKKRSEYVMTLVLAGERDRAVDFVHKLEQASLVQGLDPRWEKSQWDFLARDIESVCAEAHAREARMAKTWKLEGIWEPSPFPVELPAAERPGRSADPLFVPIPWPERPPWLLPQMPDAPGEIRFAKSIYERGGVRFLLASLTREEAELRHRNLEDYVVAARLADGRLLVIRNTAEMSDRLDPRYKPSRRGPIRVRIGLHAGICSVYASFDEISRKSSFALEAVGVLESTTHDLIWRYDATDSKNQITIDDRRKATRGRATRAPTPAERKLFACARPEFGEFEEWMTRVIDLLRVAGFGDIT